MTPRSAKRPRAAPAPAVVVTVVQMAAALPLALAPCTARAERPRIAVEHARSDAAARRVFAEVRNAGLDPVDVHGKDGAARVSELADRYGAVAVLSLRPAGRIELAVLSPETREIIYASTVTSKGGTPASVRAAEELHGRLIDLPRKETPEPATNTAAAAPPEVEPAHVSLAEEPAVREKGEPITRMAPAGNGERDTLSESPAKGAREERAHLWASAEAGSASGLRGLNEVPVFKVEARFEPMRYIGLSVFGLLPVASQGVQAAEGTAELRARIVGAMIHATVFDVANVFRLTAGAGGGAAIVSMNGRTSDPRLAARSTTAATGIGVATLGITARLLPWLSLRGEALGGLAAYRPVMRFDGRDVAAWGPTTLAFTGGFEIDALGFGGEKR
jgi:hypothetical protein